MSYAALTNAGIFAPASVRAGPQSLDRSTTAPAATGDRSPSTLRLPSASESVNLARNSVAYLRNLPFNLQVSQCVISGVDRGITTVRNDRWTVVIVKEIVIEANPEIGVAQDETARPEALRRLSCFRQGFHELLIRRADAMFEAADAVLRTDDPVRNPADLILAPERRRSHGALYNGLRTGFAKGAKQGHGGRIGG